MADRVAIGMFPATLSAMPMAGIIGESREDQRGKDVERRKGGDDKG